MPHRFYLPSINAKKDSLIITDKNVIHQIVNVLRLKKNDVIIAFSSSHEYELALKEINPETLTTTILEEKKLDREPTKKIHLYQSLLKKDNFEWVLQKSTELGIHTIVPILCNNTIVRNITPHKQKRYKKIIKEATEQCGGQHLPILQPLITFEKAVTDVANATGQKIIAWVGEHNTTISNVINGRINKIHIFIGPEGGFSPHEIELATNNKITTVNLGKRILRAETAAVAAVSHITLS